MNTKIGAALPGLLPLVILIVAEWFWGLKAGLWLAVAFGAGELLWHGLRHRRFEKRILFEMALLVVLGLVALLLDGSVLDRLRPTFYLLLMLVMVGVSAFSKYNFLMMASGRLLKNRRFGPWEMMQMRLTMQTLFWIMAVYLAMLLVAVFLMDARTETFLNTTGLYIYFGIALAVLFVIKRIQSNTYAKEEWLPLLDEDGNINGHAPRSVVHNGTTRWLHPVVHLQVLKGGGLWLQKRPMHKLVQPGKWDTAVGGHLAAGESLDVSLQREAAEEIGIDIQYAEMLGRYVWKSSLEQEMVYAYLTHYNGTITPHPEELDGGRVWSFQEIEEALGTGVFTPNFEHEYQLFRQRLQTLK